MSFELTASMMCADYGNLAKEVKELEVGGIDSFHIDIMDGHYVPNYAMSLNDLRYIRYAAKRPLDVHLMIEHPNNTIELFIDSLHPVNPGTSVENIRMLLCIVKKVLVMSVNPGNASQMFLPYVGEKYDKLLGIKDRMGFEIYWDGACGADKIREFAPKGVKGFVLGTTLLFGKGKPYGETLKRIREIEKNC